MHFSNLLETCTKPETREVFLLQNKMKKSTCQRPTFSIRPLKPKSVSPMRTACIQNLSISNDHEGNTYVTVYPNQIVFNSKELIDVIERKSDCLILGESTCIDLKDILLAIYNFPSDQNGGSSNNYDFDPMSTATPQEPKRPTNAFILYNNALRKKIKKLFPSFTNSETSKFLGAMWKTATKDVRELYIQKAVECRRIHKKRYPNFEYNFKKGSSRRRTPDTVDIVKDNWEDYFDWCWHNATGQNFDGFIELDNVLQPTPSYEVSDDKPTNTLSDNLGTYGCSLPENQDSGDWNAVYDIVSQFFPEDSNQSTSIDEGLWFCLDDFGSSIDLNGYTTVNTGTDYF